MWVYAILAAFFIANVNANVDANDITYWLTTRDVHQQIDSDQLENLGIDSSLEVKVLAHGWFENADLEWYKETTDNYVKVGGSNVIAIDWSRHAGGSYTEVVRRLEAVANHVADKLLKFADANKIRLSRFHLIGHSLGAHLFGLAGQRIMKLRGHSVGRITGLDPAGPIFRDRDQDRRLSPDDATFVDCMHTDVNIGIGFSIGHIDFYPNGGSSQNGCSIVNASCNHYRAAIYWAESIISNEFIAVRCDSASDFFAGKCNNNVRAVMGENVDRRLRGDFFLNTNPIAPFALGSL